MPCRDLGYGTKVDQIDIKWDYYSWTFQDTISVHYDLKKSQVSPVWCQSGPLWVQTQDPCMAWIRCYVEWKFSLVLAEEVSDRQEAFQTSDVVYLVGVLRGPRSSPRGKFMVLQAYGRSARGRVEVSVDFRQPQGE